MDQLNAMRAFVRVVESESFAKAAGQLQMPRSTVSKLVADLENHLGIRLLVRTTRRLSITAEGQEYYRHAKRLVAEVDFADNIVRGQKLTPGGRLRVDAPALFAHQTLIPLLPEFARDYPDIQINLGIGDRMTDLTGEGVDCVIRAGNVQDLGLVARPLMRVEMVNCVSKSYAARHGIPHTPADLPQHHIIGYFSQQTGKNKPLFFENNGETFQYAACRYAANEGNGMIAMIHAGLGLGQVFRPYVQTALDNGGLIEVLPDWQHPSLTFSLAYPPDKHRNLRLQVFADWLVRRLQGGNRPSEKAIPVADGRL